MTRTITLLLLSLVLVTAICWQYTARPGMRSGATRFNGNARIDALDLAIESKNAASLHDLLQDPAIDLNAVGGQRTGPLIHAVARGWTRAVQLLLDHGADPNRGDALGYTPLLYVAQPRPPESGEIADLLLRYGADVNRCALGGQTPLGHAVQMGRADLAQQFIAAGASVNAADDQGTTALHIATFVDQPEIVGLLLSTGADPEAKDAHGDRPIDVARQCGAVRSIKRLETAQ